MGIVAETEVTCTITIKDGDGTISNASFSVQKDPTSTNNYEQIVYKATNYKPFIMGITNIGDGYGYKNGDYKGISSVGSAVGVVCYLTFDHPVDSFTIYFDDTIENYPVSIRVNGNVYSNNGYTFFYSQALKQSQFTLTIMSMNDPSLLTPLMIVGVEDKIELFFDKRTGLKQCNLSMKKVSSTDDVVFGLYSQTGNLEVFDYSKKIDSLIDLNVLDTNASVKIRFGKDNKNLIYNYKTLKWTLSGDDIYNIELSDNLMLLQSMVITDKLMFNSISASTLLMTIMNYSGNLLTNINYDNAPNFDSNYNMRFIDIYNKTVWQVLDDFCKAFFLNGYIIDKTLYLINQHNNDTVAKSNSDIVIPLNTISGFPSVNRLSVVNYNQVNVEAFNIIKQDSDVQDSEFVKINSIDLDNNYTWGNDWDSQDFYAGIYTYQIITAYYDALKENNWWDFSFDEPWFYLYGYDGLGERHRISYGEIPNVYNDSSLFTYLTNENPPSFVAYQQPIDKSNIKVYIVINLNNLNSQGLSRSRIDAGLGSQYIETESLSRNQRTLIYGSGNNVYDYSGSNFLLTDMTSFINNGSKIVMKGLSNKPRIKFSMAVVNLFDKAGNLVYDINNGQILGFDRLVLQDFDGNDMYNKVWFTYATTFRYDGSFFMDVEGVGYKDV